MTSDEDEVVEQTPKDLTNVSAEELAAFGLQKHVAALCDELHWAIDEGIDAEVLHDIVGLWEVNRGDISFDGLVEDGRPAPCHDCARDVMPFDERGHLVEGGSEWYMVTDPVWSSATNADESVAYLCIGCLEGRLGRPLVPDDFADLPVNEPSWTNTPRLHALLLGRSGQTDGT